LLPLPHIKEGSIINKIEQKYYDFYIDRIVHYVEQSFSETPKIFGEIPPENEFTQESVEFHKEHFILGFQGYIDSCIRSAVDAEKKKWIVKLEKRLEEKDEEINKLKKELGYFE